MSSEDPVAIVKRLYQAFKQGDMETIMALYDDEVEIRVGGDADLAFAGEFHGHDGVRAYMKALKDNVETEVFEPKRFFSDDSHAIVEGFTRSIPFETGEPYEIDWVMVYRIEDGSIVEYRHYYDTDAVLDAFGVS